MKTAMDFYSGYCAEVARVSKELSVKPFSKFRIPNLRHFSPRYRSLLRGLGSG